MLSSVLDVAPRHDCRIAARSHAVPQTMLPQSAAAAGRAPDDIVARVGGPHTMLSPSAACPSTSVVVVGGAPDAHYVRPSAPQTVPQATASPAAVRLEPHITSVLQALAFGRSTPPPMRWLPQLMCVFHGRGIADGTSLPGGRGCRRRDTRQLARRRAR